jgi:hypothetical protein
LVELLKYTLHHTVQRHPSLCYGLVEEKNNVDAHFYQLESIEFDDVVEIRLSKLPKEQQDRAMEKEIGVAHDHLFQEQDRKPGWKIVVLKHESEVFDNDTRVDVIYVNQHAIGDGTSAAAFHKTFIRFLHQAMDESDLQVSWPYEVPTELPELQLIEKVCPFPSKFASSVESKIVTSDDPSFDAWTAALPTMDRFASRARTLTIPSIDVSRIISYCRQLKTTLTGLLHSLFVIHLAKTVQDARGFRAVTPYSMRRFSGASDDEILNHISYITIDWKESVASLARSTQENSKGEEEVIFKITKQYQSEITEELCNVPQRGSAALIEVSNIEDLNKFCEDGLKEKRGCTYEISNIGAVTLPEIPAGSEGVQLEKLTFTQCGMFYSVCFRHLRYFSSPEEVLC